MKLIEGGRSAHRLRSVGDQLDRIHPDESTWLANDPCLLALMLRASGLGAAYEEACREWAASGEMMAMGTNLIR